MLGESFAFAARNESLAAFGLMLVIIQLLNRSEFVEWSVKYDYLVYQSDLVRRVEVSY